MKKVNILFILILFFNLLHAQNSLVKQWDYRYGGSDHDEVFTFFQTADAGYMMGGWSRSPVSGDITQPNWDTTNAVPDFWIVKTDSNGIMQWNKRYGGTKTDECFSIKQTTDGGYILGGTSTSGLNGDKTQDNWDTTYSTNDYWIIKIDPLGNKQWDRRYGGTRGDYFRALTLTNDGGYLLGGYSISDSSGDKTQNKWGGFYDRDYWIVKIDSLGNKQWDKDFGGTDDDWFLYLQQTNDGGYVLAGWSYSGISGDKTEDNWDGTHATCDYWIIKTDMLGNKQWDKRYGGNHLDKIWELKQTTDGGYILGGNSVSGISGNKTQPCWGSYDYWMVKIDSLGIFQWDKRYGGTDWDETFSVSQNIDGGYLISGNSMSEAGGDKTENNLGSSQTWIIKTDSLGNIKWDKTIVTPGDDEAGFAIETADKCYVISNDANGGIGGYRSQQCWGIWDYWIIKFCDTTQTSSINPANQNQNQVSILSNPFSSQLSITIHKQSTDRIIFSIKNMFGQTVFIDEMNSQSSKTIDLSFLAKGIYLLDVTVDGERTVKKIVKE